MEGPVKERLTGALILIAALVIVVPEMLSGPDAPSPSSSADTDAGPPLRTYELQLDTPAASRNEDQSALSPQSAPNQANPSQPTPGAAPAVAEAPAKVEPQVVAEKPVPEKPVAEQPVPEKPVATVATAPAAERTPAATATGGNWWIQLGSFSSRENAERLQKQLRAAGYPISVSPIKSNGKELYRVRAGPVPSREAAAGLQGRLAAAGHKSSLVAP